MDIEDEQGYLLPHANKIVFSPSAMDTGFKQELSTLVFLRLQHRFLPCENKSKAVEQVKNDFNKVSGKEGACNTTSVHSAKHRRWAGPILHLACGNSANGVTSSAS